MESVSKSFRKFLPFPPPLMSKTLLRDAELKSKMVKTHLLIAECVQ